MVYELIYIHLLSTLQYELETFRDDRYVWQIRKTSINQIEKRF